MRVRNTVDFNKISLKARRAIQMYGATQAKQLEAAAKKDAPWVDRTSNARNSIQGDFEWQGPEACIVLSGNVDYFPYLELTNSKKYAVLVPTIQRASPEVLAGYKRLVMGW